MNKKEYGADDFAVFFCENVCPRREEYMSYYKDPDDALRAMERDHCSKCEYEEKWYGI